MSLASTVSRSVLFFVTSLIFPWRTGWYRLRPMQAMETEVKIRVADREIFEQKLPALGFSRVTARTLERNTLYDTAAARITQFAADTAHSRVWKQVGGHAQRIPDGGNEEGPYKNRVETETVIEDGPVLGKIFEALGFSPVFVYEKWRTEWGDQQGHCVLDETPLGLYAELEGSTEWIDATAEALGIKESQFITLSYGRIFEDWRDKTGSKATNLTFAEIPERFQQESLVASTAETIEPQISPATLRSSGSTPKPSLGFRSVALLVFLA